MYNIYKTFLFAIYEPFCTIFTFSQKHIYKNIFCLQVFTKTFFTYKFVTKHVFQKKQIYTANSQMPRFSCNIGFIFSSFYSHKAQCQFH